MDVPRRGLRAGRFWIGVDPWPVRRGEAGERPLHRGGVGNFCGRRRSAGAGCGCSFGSRHPAGGSRGWGFRPRRYCRHRRHLRLRRRDIQLLSLCRRRPGGAACRRVRLACRARGALARGGGGNRHQFAVPDQGGEAGQTFGDFLDEADDQRNQRRDEPPALVLGAPRIRALAEPVAQVGEAVCRGGGWRIVHTVWLLQLMERGQGKNDVFRYFFLPHNAEFKNASQGHPGDFAA